MADSVFKRLAEDLLHLEVNTIIKSQMSGQKMPDSSRRTLYEIAMTYSGELVRLGKELQYPSKEASKTTNGFRGKEYWNFGGLGSFEELKDRADKAIHWIDQQAPEYFSKSPAQVNNDKKMIERVRDNSHRILGIFFRLAQLYEKKKGLKKGEINNKIEVIKSLRNEEKQNPSNTETIEWNNDINPADMNQLLVEEKDLELDPRELMMIKKAWDIGVEEIMVQTIVGIDGDVTTRILERFANNPDKTVLNLHNEGLQTSIGLWTKMVDTVTQIVEGTIGLILTGGKKNDNIKSE